MPGSTVDICPCCGKVLGPNELAVDYTWPDPLADLPAATRDAAIEFYSGVFLVSKYGVAIRVILPVHLDSGHPVTIGVWLSLHGADGDRVNTAAREGGDAWIGCTFTGMILNDIQPWPGTYGARAT